MESPEPRPEAYGYESPNEYYPAQAIPVVSAAPEGIYIGVGADRTFNLASISPRINRIVCLDSDPGVVQFNLFNIFLLQSSTSREDYEHLRLYAGWQEFAARLAQVKSRLHPSVLNAITEANFTTIRHLFATDRQFQVFHESPIDAGGPFNQVNYLRNEAQYLRLKLLAEQGRIEAHLVNLKDEAFFEELARRVATELSIIDVSNAWGSRYIGRALIAALLNKLGPLNPYALFLYTSLLPKGSAHDFKYGAFRLKSRAALLEKLYASETPPFGLLADSPPPLTRARFVRPRRKRCFRLRLRS